VVHLGDGSLQKDGGSAPLLLIHDLPRAETMGRLAIRQWRVRPQEGGSDSTLLYGRDSVIA
jgi:hypothetical protein